MFRRAPGQGRSYDARREERWFSPRAVLLHFEFLLFADGLCDRPPGGSCRPGAGGQRLELVLHVRVARLRGHRGRGLVAPHPRGTRRSGRSGCASARRSIPVESASRMVRPGATGRSSDAPERRNGLASLTSVDPGGSLQAPELERARRSGPAGHVGRIHGPLSSSGWPPSRPPPSSASSCSWSCVVRRSHHAGSPRRWPRRRRRHPEARHGRPGLLLACVSTAAMRCRCQLSAERRSSSTSSPRGAGIAGPS